MHRLFAVAVVLIAIIFAVGPFKPQAAAQSGEGWTQLFDGKTLANWTKVGESNWRVEDGAMVADKGGKSPGYLLSKNSYKDFMLHIEFWASHDANSGIYMRCFEADKGITDRKCYEANIFDERKDPSYGTGAITRYVEVNPMPKAAEKWSTYEITMKGRDLTVVLNGKETSRLRNGMFDDGPFALQHGAGTIKFRKVAIKPL
jgi:hypothetical protein